MQNSSTTENSLRILLQQVDIKTGKYQYKNEHEVRGIILYTTIIYCTVHTVQITVKGFYYQLTFFIPVRSTEFENIYFSLKSKKEVHLFLSLSNFLNVITKSAPEIEFPY